MKKSYGTMHFNYPSGYTVEFKNLEVLDVTDAGVLDWAKFDELEVVVTNIATGEQVDDVYFVGETMIVWKNKITFESESAEAEYEYGEVLTADEVEVAMDSLPDGFTYEYETTGKQNA